MAKEKRTTPLLRFPEFTDDWEQRGLRTAATFSKGSGYSKNDLKENGTPIILYGRLYTKYETVINEVDTFVDVQPNSVYSTGHEVIVPASGETAEDISRASFVAKSGILLGGDLNIIVPEDYINPVFLALTISNGNQQKELSKRAQGKSVVHIHNSDLENVVLLYPKYEEQEKIGEYFSKLDSLITLHQREYDKLKELKKAMLQKMFPKKGETVPEIRFPEFTDDWEQRKFSELYVKMSEKNDLSFGIDKIISVANMYFKEDAKESSDDYMRTYNIMRLGDIAFEGNKSKNFAHGRFVENTIGDGIVSHVFDVFRPITDYDLMFWKYIINNESVMGRVMTRCTKASTMMTNLVANDFLKESIYVPSIEEQKKIGAYLSNLDTLITLHQRECDKLKELKKGLLQQMFI